MWRYEKRLQYPINIKKRTCGWQGPLSHNTAVLTRLSASLRYLNQRYSMPDDNGKALLTDIGTEELAHMEMVATMVHQLMKGATIEELREAGMDRHFAQRGNDLFLTDAFGNPWTAAYIGAVGDPVADLSENMAAEQKARAVYENLIELATDPAIIDPLVWLREREVVHFEMFRQLYDRYKNLNLI